MYIYVYYEYFIEKVYTKLLFRKAFLIKEKKIKEFFKKNFSLQRNNIKFENKNLLDLYI